MSEVNRRGVTRIFTRYTVASLLATGLSQVVLLGLYWWNGMGAMTASAIAFVVGAVPHFLLVRRWAWGRTGQAGRQQEIVAYVVVTALTGLMSIGVTTLADWLLDPLIADRGWRTIWLNVAYVVSGALVFLLKFFALNRVFRQTAKAASESQDADAATSAPQPHAA